MRKLPLLGLAMFLMVSQLLFAQTKTISGKVTDRRDGSPLPGVSVQVKGTSTGAVTGTDGTFSFTAPASASTLVVSSLGFDSQEIAVSGSLLSISLVNEESRNLEEIVVVGYGTKIKKDLTGNIATVKGSEIQGTPVSNFNQALQGRAAGVFVEANNGKVGEGVKILIRGSSSISGSNAPLYVIDGVPINTSTYSGNAIADINFNDVESFDILKDASAASIYGSRAANGVVLITTKKGKAGKTVVQLNSQYGTNRPTNLRGFLNASEYVELIREAAINSDLADGYDPLDPANYPDSYLEYVELTMDDISGHTSWRDGLTNTNWEKKAFNYDAKTYAVDVSASGGTEKTKFYLSSSLNRQDGILIGNNFRRISARFNLDHAVSEQFKVGFNLSVAQTTANRVSADNAFSTPMQIVALSPITPFANEDGVPYNSPVTTYPNPYVDYTDGKYESITYRNIGNVFGQYNFTPSIFFRTEFGIDVQNQNDDQFYGFNTDAGSGTNGYGESDWFRSLDYNVNNYFTFKKMFGQKHDFDATAGMSYQRYNSEYAEIYGQQFPVEDLKKLASSALITGGTSVESNSSFLSYFARANYKFDNKYLLALSGRIDGSSRFGKDNQYGFFPAVSAGWIMSEESFMRNSSILSFLKIRGSWGLTGNAEGFGDFGSLGLWNAGSYNGTSGLTPTQLANSKLQWEKSDQVDIGIDFGFLRNRISGQIDFYNRKTKDLIYNVPVPSNSGFTTQLTNVGSMQNKGFEFVLNTENVILGGFRWSSNINASFNRNKLLKLDGSQTIIPGNDGRYLNSLIVGESIGVFYGPKYAGVDPANGDALYYQADGKTTTASYNAAGNFVVGNPNPKVIAGFGNTFSFKGIELNVLFQGVFGNQVMNGAGGFMSASFDYFDNQTREILDRWQNPGDITNEPQVRFLGGNGISASSRYIFDADYVRLKNITLAYNIPAALVRKFRISSAKVYVTAVNLITFTDYPGWDPEVNTDYRGATNGNRNQGADFYAAPQIRNISFGLNLGF
ncbi:MAG: TonB-dependent receptor [Chitinophagaceae bacterium]